MEFTRFLLKLSGEALTENGYRGLKADPVEAIIREVHSVWPQHQVALLVGGGNIGRGSQYIADLRLPDSAKVAADWAGMVATYINGCLLKEKMQLSGIDTRLMLAKPFGDIGEPFYKDVAISHLNKGRVIILAGGTGFPRFTTDTAAVLRATELDAALVLKGTKVDGVYNDDPIRNPDATRLPYVVYDDFLSHRPPLRILDTAAVALARDNHLRVRVFNIFERDSLSRVLAGQGVFSEIGPPA